MYHIVHTCIYNMIHSYIKWKYVVKQTIFTSSTCELPQYRSKVVHSSHEQIEPMARAGLAGEDLN